MANRNSKEFEQFRDYVQYFTMGAALLCAAVWVIHTYVSSGFDARGGVINGLSIATEVGGTAMGILYLIHKSREK